ncbi:hypothetical protein PC112_g23319, partial [Phytophthora cactorum]
ALVGLQSHWWYPSLVQTHSAHSCQVVLFLLQMPRTMAFPCCLSSFLAATAAAFSGVRSAARADLKARKQVM